MDTSFLSHSHSYIDSLYQQFLQDPQTLPASWRTFFTDQDFFAPTPSVVDAFVGSDMASELKVQMLIEQYRKKGHLKGRTNPIRARKDRDPGLELADFGLTPQHLSRPFHACQALGVQTLQEAIDRLEAIYCHHLGFEYYHISNRQRREWLQREIESTAQHIDPPVEQKICILKQLNEATGFEKFLGIKYIGQKRFSLEGGENTITAMNIVVNHASEQGVQEVVIGMAHRGRLNILSSIMGKSYEYIFSEFEGMEEARRVTSRGDGDVKYHLGFKARRTTAQGGEISLKLMPNPSHLEAVAPVVEGYARGRADAIFVDGYCGHPEKVLPLIIHGDAALAGQGVVYEVAQMSKLPGYFSGGTIHFIINNQIGFTTNFDEGRTSLYCTDIAKVTDSPVIHINGDDAEAVAYAAELSVRYRQQFGEDIYLDMVCYRKYGHNESDEPKYTQPKLYGLIQQHPTPFAVYAQKLVEQGHITPEEPQRMAGDFKARLQECLDRVRNNEAELKQVEPDDEWASFRLYTPSDFEHSPPTAFARTQLRKIHHAITTVPAEIKPIKKALKVLENRNRHLAADTIDWALAELYAYGSLLLEGHDVRLSGQDCLRGTFGHRHGAILDEKTAQHYMGLNHIRQGQGKLNIYNSLLSEYAVMGFEYGYGLARPEALVIWEAQFGDFSNTAQVIVDQFISSAHSKWNINNGLMLYLPHGYEGQGPEHSSARAERYLQLCAEFNMIVANCTTPSNLFHLIRRQLKYPFRIPAVLFTPKGLLRHPQCVSTLAELAEGRFQEYLDDEFCRQDQVKRVLMCTGKIFYDLKQHQVAQERRDVAIVRLEQLHPLPFVKIDQMLERYAGAEIIWVQEEPKNMGFWNYITRKFDYLSPQVISRKSSASTATGYMSLHLEEQRAIIDQAFG